MREGCSNCSNPQTPAHPGQAAGWIYTSCPCSFAQPCSQLPSSALCRWRALPPVARREEGHPNLSWCGPSQAAALKREGRWPHLGQRGLGPTLCSSPHLPSLPPYPCEGGFGEVLRHTLHQDFSQTNIQGFPSCRVGGAAACPAEDLAVDRTWGKEAGMVVGRSICWLLSVS